MSQDSLSSTVRAGNKKQLAILSFIGGILFLGFLWMSQLGPLRENVPSFLIIQLSLFVVFFLATLFLKKIKPAAAKVSFKEVLVIFFFAFLFRLCLVQTAPSLSDDIYRYLWDGRVQNAGINPYLHPPSAPELNDLKDDAHELINHPDIRTVYPLVSQFAFRLGAAINPTIHTQRLMFTFFDLGVVALLMILLAIKKKSSLWAIVYAWNPLVVVEFAGSGHHDSLMLFFLVLGFVLFESGHLRSLGVTFFSFSALVKFTPLVLVPWLYFQQKRRFLILFVLVFFLGLEPFISGKNNATGLATYAKDWLFNPSFFGVFSQFISNPQTIKIFFGLILILFSIAWAKLNQDNGLKYLFGVFYVVLLASPVVHPWYVIWIVPFLCFFPLWSGLLWTGLVNLTYLVLIAFVRDGVWSLPTWILWVEYGVVLSILFFETIARRGRPPCRPKWRGKLGGHGGPPLRTKNFVSVIIPAMNEENAITQVINEIPKELVGEIIVVDNGSTDNTVEKAKKAGARVFKEPRRGYGRAVLTGMAELSPESDTVVVLDGDHSDYPEELALLLDPIKKGEADFVIGNRTKFAEPRSLTPQQIFGNKLTCFLLEVIYGFTYSDMGPFRVIRRSALEQMNMEDQNFGWNVEMQVKALQLGLKIKEVDVRYRPRIGLSKISGTIKGTIQAGVIILWSVFYYSLNKTLASDFGSRISNID